MKAEFKKGDIEFDMYTDLYTFHRDFGVPENADAYWTALIERVDEIVEKYKDTVVEGIVSHHLINVMELLNKKAREGQAV